MEKSLWKWLILCVVLLGLVGCSSKEDAASADERTAVEEQDDEKETKASISLWDFGEKELFGERMFDGKEIDAPAAVLPDASMKLAEYVFYNEKGEMTNKYTYTYDSHYNICVQNRYEGDGTLADVIETDISYLSDGRVEQEIVTDPYYDMHNISTYSWDPTGRIVYIDHVDSEGNSIGMEMKAYDDLGRLIEYSSEYSITNFTYSENQLIELVYSYGTDTAAYTITNYNKTGQMTEKKYYEVSGYNEYSEDDLIEYRLYAYGDNGLDYIMEIYDAAGVLQGTKACTYENDGCSNTVISYDAEGMTTDSYRMIYKPIEELQK